ncbi:odorant receptor 13a-like isoform X3 [Bombus vosnesenskii]|uniref:Odorant receptor 13a-like isoform X3 n=3 Tax=Pyrobombus TaxID=144703 RepID=A0A6J3LKW0_9HYME|nr:odorant receptor 13a isoform X3 [Bombus impatiens]XP_033187397.1 odorant receptor 13a-like isoform X3 [Bombus vancouverensis nearcticus]XP_033302025.1 odorant receptor 13a-like isoform X3 [Bombus bifarius]XP_033366153.1 odorant receptor 13a-like isoform X3 [Bombus vosnesenskii]
MLATDGLIATALLHTCGHFAVLRKNVKQLDSYIYRVCIVFYYIYVYNCNVIYFKIIQLLQITRLKTNSKHINANLYEIKIQIIHVIKHHQVVLWFCDNMEKNFHLILFLQAMISSLLICFVGFQVSATLMEQSKMIKFASHLIVAFFQLLLFCFPGDMLIQEVDDII